MKDYTYDADGQITTWKKNYAGLAAPQRFDLGYDNAGQLTTAPLKFNLDGKRFGNEKKLRTTEMQTAVANRRSLKLRGSIIGWEQSAKPDRSIPLPVSARADELPSEAPDLIRDYALS